MLKLLLDVYSSNPDSNGRCDVAFVDLFYDLARVVFQRMDTVRTLATDDQDLTEIHYLQREQLRQEIETHHSPHGIRQRLLARRKPA